MTTAYKPSPLSYGSPRSSPFRRPDSNPPSPLRHSTPNPSPTKMATAAVTTPSRLARASTPSAEPETGTRTPRGVASVPRDREREREASPTRGAGSPGFGAMLTQRNTGTGSGNDNALSKLQPAQVRELREGFQVLDRDSDGLVGRDDVADMLTQLGTYTPCFASSSSPLSRRKPC